MQQLNNVTGLKTPKGFNPTARGCAYPRYPGNVMNGKHNPKGVASHHATPDATPLGLLGRHGPPSQSTYPFGIAFSNSLMTGNNPS